MILSLGARVATSPIYSSQPTNPALDVNFISRVEFLLSKAGCVDSRIVSWAVRPEPAGLAQRVLRWNENTGRILRARFKTSRVRRRSSHESTLLPIRPHRRSGATRRTSRRRPKHSNYSTNSSCRTCNRIIPPVLSTDDPKKGCRDVVGASVCTSGSRAPMYGVLSLQVTSERLRPVSTDCNGLRVHSSMASQGKSSLASTSDPLEAIILKLPLDNLRGTRAFSMTTALSYKAHSRVEAEPMGPRETRPLRSPPLTSPYPFMRTPMSLRI